MLSVELSVGKKVVLTETTTATMKVSMSAG
jgi:hypothetical protein